MFLKISQNSEENSCARVSFFDNVEASAPLDYKGLDFASIQNKKDESELRKYTVQEMTFSIKDFFGKCDQICSFQPIWSHLLKKSFMENFICAVRLRPIKGC